MDRELLQVYLRSGPARQFDIRFFTQTLREAGGGADDQLFSVPFLNQAILFKCAVSRELACHASDRPICTIVYLPFDPARPGDGGESFTFSEDGFWECIRYKLRVDRGDADRFDTDFSILSALDSIPTLSPLIMELAIERAGLKVPAGYLDLPPAVRTKLISFLKTRIRPLVIAAFDRSKVNIDRAVEQMTSKFLLLRDVAAVAPLVKALRIPEGHAVEVLSSWIGLTYFEYEYAAIQPGLRDLADWIGSMRQPRWTQPQAEKEAIESLVQFSRTTLRDGWSRVIAVSAEYRNTYDGLLNRGQVAPFAEFLATCRKRYWDMAEILGRFEQTAQAWRRYKPNIVGQEARARALTDFAQILRRLHSTPLRAKQAGEKSRGSTAGGFSNLTSELF